MPFTPFHFGPALLIGLLLLRWLDVPTLLAASVAVDFRATLVFFAVLDGPLHGPLHTLAGSAALAALLAAGGWVVRPWLDPVLDVARLPQPRRPRSVALAALGGVWIHVALDALLYADLAPFAPVSAENPLLGLTSASTVYLGCMAAGSLGLVLYGLQLAGFLRLDSRTRERPRTGP